MSILEPIRRGAEEFVDALSEGWDWLRGQSANALTRFSRPEGVMEDDVLPMFARQDRWGLLASEVSETDEEVIVRIEAPGLCDEDFSIFVEAEHLVVRGQKRFSREDHKAQYHLFESAYGAFERRLPLPCRVDSDHAKARYRKGVLTVRLPRAEQDRRRRIPIQAA